MTRDDSDIPAAAVISTAKAFRRGIILALLLGGWLTPWTSSAARSLTVNDVLRMEDIGQVVLVKDDRVAVFEWTGPYEEAQNLEILHAQDERRPLATLYAVDINRPESRRPLFEQDPAGTYWLGSVSPDRTKLAIYALVNGEFKAGVVDLALERVMWFDFTPSFHRLHEAPVWISHEELIYPAMSPGELPPFMFRQVQTRRLVELWDRAFRGKEPSTTVMSSTRSGTVEADRFRPGTLVKVNARTGKSAAIATGFFYNLRLSPDGRYLATLKEGGAIQPDPARPFAGVADALRTQIVIYDLASGVEASVPCGDCNVAVGSLTWSADGRSLVLFARRVGEAMNVGRFLRYMPADGSLTAINTEGLRLACSRTLWRPREAVTIGNRIAVFATPDARNTDEVFSPTECSRNLRFDWFVIDEKGGGTNLTSRFDSVSGELVGITRDALFVLADGAVWRLGEDGTRRNLTRALGSSLRVWQKGLEEFTYAEEARSVGLPPNTLKATLQSPRSIISLDLRTGKYSVANKPRGAAQLVEPAASVRTAIFASVSNGSRELLFAGKDGIARPLVSINTHLRAVVPARQTDLRYEIGGRSVTSCLLLPPDRTPAPPHPTIVWLYPGIDGRCVFSELHSFNPYSAQLLAAHGFAVLFANTARAVIETPEGPTRRLTGAVLAAVDEAVRAGYADPERLGLFGFSQGYHSVLQVITESNRFRSAIASHGISDFASQYGSILLSTRLAWSGFAAGGAARFENRESDNYLGAMPWQDPQRYVLNSPLFFADRIETPLLIMHSDFDAFSLDQTGEIFSALYRLRKDAEYVTYWGETHGNLSPANIRDMWRRTFESLDRDLHHGPLDR